MKLILLGPPGAGKGTIAKMLAEKNNMLHISTGDLFRQAIADHTELGLKVKSILDGGGLVPDDLTVALVRDFFENTEISGGYILDGFPRTLPQADGLSAFSKIDGVINFQVQEDLIIKRLSGRRIAKGSGRIYHVLFNPPKREGFDDETGEPLIQRPDDQEEAIRTRLAVYKKETEPLIEYYEDKNLLFSLDGSGTPEEVLELVSKTLSTIGGQQLFF